MATANPFDLLIDDDNDDPSQLISKLPVAAAKSPAGAVAAKPAGKLPSKPILPTQAVQEARNDGRGGGRFVGRGNGRGGRGGRGFNRDFSENENNSNGTNNNGFNGGYRPSEDGDIDRFERRAYNNNGPRGGGGFRGGRRGGYTNGGGDADGDRPRRTYERHSGTGRGNEHKRGGAGSGNWGTATDEIVGEAEVTVIEVEKNVETEKPAGQEEVAVDANKDNAPATETQEKDADVKVFTLGEYEKILEEKRQALLALKSEERKVDLDKDLAKMQLLANKKSEEDIFVKLGAEKEKRKETTDKEEKPKKTLNIDGFLQPARYIRPGGQGRGRGRGGPREGGGRGGYGNREDDVAPPPPPPRKIHVPAPVIEDVAQFPSLGVK